MMVRILNKLEYCTMFVEQEPERFVLNMSPWGTPMLIDKEYSYYEKTPYK